jgi:hypothetical protein
MLSKETFQGGVSAVPYRANKMLQDRQFADKTQYLRIKIGNMNCITDLGIKFINNINTVLGAC